MAFLQKLFLARYSVFAGAILFLLPIIVLQLGIFSTLLAGLFDLNGFWEMFWATFFAYLLAFSVFVTFRISSAYGALRCGLTNAKHNDKAVSGWRQKILFALVLILPLPMVLNAFWLVGSWRQVSGAVVGFAAALLVVFFVDFGQRLFNTFQGEHADSAKHLLLPFSYPFSSWAEEKDLASRVFSAPTFLRIQNWVHKLDPKYGIGIINRECVPASIYPGIVLGIALFFAFLSIYFVGFTFWIWQIGDGSLLLDLRLTTMSFFLVLITLLCWLLIGITFYADRFRIPTIILLLLILVFSQADHTYLVRQSDAAFVASTPHSILRSRNKDRYIILVAANGGGIQSAAWTAEVLTRIDEECRKVDPDEDGCRNAIALISGVSGGSVGTMYFVDGYGDTEDPAAMNEVVRRSASRSSLAYVGGGLVFNDAMRNVPLLNWVFANEMDRGKHLMQGWIRNRTHSECESLESRHLACDSSKNLLVPTRLSQTMSQWGNNIANERRPAVIFNATMVESGRRLLFSSAHFETKPKETADWITFNQLFGDSNDVDVVEAVRLSASFPFVTPAAASLGGNGSQNDHVVDGGYFDNYGLMSVRDFVADSLSTNPFDSENRPKVIVIQIYGDEVVRDVNGDPDPEKSRQLNQHRFGLFSWYQQTFAPLNTMLSVRQTSQYSRNEDAFNEIVRLLEGKADVSHFVFKFSKNKKIISAKPDQPVDALDTVRESPASVAAEDYEPPPLSWHLTTREKTAIKQVSCEMRSGLDLNENTTNWKSLMDLLRNPKSTGDWNRCSTVDQ